MTAITGSQLGGPVSSHTEPNVTNAFQITSGDSMNPTIYIQYTGAANAAASDIPTIVNASFGQASTLTIPDPGVASTSFVFTSQVGNVTTVSVTLTPAQMVTAYATPLVLVPAPGAGKVILIQEASVYTASTGNTPYATGTAPVIQYDTTAHGAGTVATSTGLVAGDITASSSQIRSLANSAAVLTGISNKGIYFSNATGAYTAGTGTNVTISLTYQTVTATV